MRGGTYAYSVTIVIAENNSGTASANKRIVAYNGETPVLDFSGQALSTFNRGLVLDGDYWYISGLTITGAGDNACCCPGAMFSGDAFPITILMTAGIFMPSRKPAR